MKRTIAKSVAICIGLAAHLSSPHTSAASDSATSPTTIDLVNFLTRYGSANHFIFTLELAQINGTLIHPSIEYTGAIPQESYAQPTYLISHLPNFRIIPATSRPRTFHLISTSLENNASYSLNQVVGTFDYTGSPVDMLAHLSAIVPSIKNLVTTEIGNGPIIIDMTSRISVSAKTTNVRDILTSGLPDAYNPVIWVAVTDTVRNEPTGVTFQGAIARRL